MHVARRLILSCVLLPARPLWADGGLTPQDVARLRGVSSVAMSPDGAQIAYVLNRRAASRHDYNLRMIQWFEHYLKGPGGAAPPYEIEYPAAAAR